MTYTFTLQIVDNDCYNELRHYIEYVKFTYLGGS